MRAISLLVSCLFLLPSAVFSQRASFSLGEAQEYALANSYKTRTSSLDVEYQKKGRKGFISLGLPQISGSAKYQYYIDIPTQLMPNFLTPAVEGILVQQGLITPQQMSPASDEKFEVQFGSKNNFSADLTVGQLIFDGTFVVGLKAAQLLVDMSRNAEIKSQIEVRESVAQAYYLVLIAEENRSLLDSTLRNMKSMLTQVSQYQKSGFMEETDVQQLELLVSNLTNRRAMVDRQVELASDLLKFQMGMDIDQEIELKDGLSDLLNNAIGANLIGKPFDVNSHIDFRTIKTSELLLSQTLKVDRSRYYPSLSCFITTQRSAQRNEFNFFDFSEENKWYRATIFGVGLSVPIWSSGVRHYKIQQDRINIDKQKLVSKQVEQALKLEVQSARSNLRTYTDQYNSEIQNLRLSKSIYDKTAIKFKEGVSSSMDLNQAYNQYLTTQGNYFNAVMQLLNSYSQLNKALNNY